MMFGYYLKLALHNIKRAPVLYGLVIMTLAIGCGAFVANLALLKTMASDPLPSKSDKVFHVSLSTWPGGPRNDIPFDVTAYRDAKPIEESGIADNFATFYRSQVYTKAAEAKSLTRTSALTLVTSPGFFDIMAAPFLYGTGFESDRGNNVVISKALNDTLFGGENSVGKSIDIEESLFTIVGVLDTWELRPKFYNIHGGQAFSATEDLFVPLETGLDRDWRNNTRTTSHDNMDNMADSRTKSVFHLQTWVQLDTPEKVAQMQDFLDRRGQELKDKGIHPHDIDNRLHSVTEWLKQGEVVDKKVTAFAFATALFLIVCLFNASSLLLARYNGNNFETGLKRALGVSKTQIMQQGIVEGAVSGAIAGLMAIALSFLFLKISASLLPNFAYVAVLDADMLVVGFFIALITTIVSALYPVIRSSQTSISAELKG